MKKKILNIYRAHNSQPRQSKRSPLFHIFSSLGSDFLRASIILNAPARCCCRGMPAPPPARLVSFVFFFARALRHKLPPPLRRSEIAGRRSCALERLWGREDSLSLSLPSGAFIAAHLARQRAWKLLLVYRSARACVISQCVYTYIRISFESWETVMGFRIINLLRSGVYYFSPPGFRCVSFFILVTHAVFFFEGKLDSE